MKLSNRFKSKALWVSFASFIFILLQTYDVPVIASEYDALVNSLLAILVGLGILTNPDKEKDDK